MKDFNSLVDFNNIIENTNFFNHNEVMAYLIGITKLLKAFYQASKISYDEYSIYLRKIGDNMAILRSK